MFTFQQFLQSYYIEIKYTLHRDVCKYNNNVLLKMSCRSDDLYRNVIILLTRLYTLT